MECSMWCNKLHISCYLRHKWVYRFWTLTPYHWVFPPDEFLITWSFMYSRCHINPVQNLYTLTWTICGSSTTAFQRRLLYFLVKVLSHKEWCYITRWHGDERNWSHSGYLPLMLRWAYAEDWWVYILMLNICGIKVV